MLFLDGKIMAIQVSRNSDATPKRGLLVRILVSTTSLIVRTVIVFLVLEGVLRLTGVKPQIALLNPSGPFEEDAALKWKLKANFRGKWSGVDFQTNSLGLRDDEPQARLPQEARVLMLGGSITTGYAMERPQGYTDQLEELLGRTQMRKSTVWNAGVPGYAVFQESIMFDRLFPALQPDYVLLDFAINDVIDKQMNLKALGGKGEFRGGGAFLRFDHNLKSDRTQEFLNDLPRYSALYTGARWLKVKVLAKHLKLQEEDREKALLEKLLIDPPPPELEKAWQETLGELKELQTKVKAQNRPFWIVMFPLREQVERDSGLDAPQKRLAQFCQQNGIVFVDLLEAFRAKRRKGVEMASLFLDNDHPTQTGHNLAASELLRALDPVLTPIVITPVKENPDEAS